MTRTLIFTYFADIHTKSEKFPDGVEEGKSRIDAVLWVADDTKKRTGDKDEDLQSGYRTPIGVLNLTLDSKFAGPVHDHVDGPGVQALTANGEPVDKNYESTQAIMDTIAIQLANLLKLNVDAVSAGCP